MAVILIGQNGSRHGGEPLALVEMAKTFARFSNISAFARFYTNKRQWCVCLFVGTFGRLRGNRKRSRGNEIFPDRTKNMRSPHPMPSKDQNRIGGRCGACATPGWGQRCH
eukprot:scaffold541_cov182-Skeletonema_marinoi.AAC.1